MEQNVCVVDNEKTALYIACERASVPYIKLLLQMNSDMNASTSRGTVLHAACLEVGFIKTADCAGLPDFC
ncbi:hypothetical protein CDAR_215111 [Caerostris darwini]|uniref:Uncharacterized protein n=1 Tax=Caerostris darwini TaxID=1538125 RepID=A0AAV4QMW0_9ARAC|nr:hypothetical protein CDAR_215111 [Caerostris darwini]